MFTKINVNVRDLLYLWKRCAEKTVSDVSRGTICPACISNEYDYRLTIDAMNDTIRRLVEIRDAITKMREDRKREDDKIDEDKRI